MNNYKKLIFMIFSLLYWSIEVEGQQLDQAVYVIRFEINQIHQSCTNGGGLSTSRITLHYKYGNTANIANIEMCNSVFSGCGFEIECPNTGRLESFTLEMGGSCYLNYQIQVTYPCMDQKNVSVSNGYITILTYSLSVKIKEFDIKTYNGYSLSQAWKPVGGVEDIYLTDILFFGLMATSINIDGHYENYTWEAKIGDGNWQILPSYYNTCELRCMNGNDFSNMLPDKTSLKDIIENNSLIYFRVKSDCGIYSSTVTVHPRLSSPKITSIDKIPETCHDAEDGKMIVHFSRTLYEKELLQVNISGRIIDVPPLSDSCVITGLKSGTNYDITLAGRYPFNN